MPIKATFHNFRILEAFAFRRTLGVTPDVCQLMVAVPKNPKRGPGDLTISDGRSTLRVREMHPRAWQKTSGEAGTLEIADLRVTWHFKPCLFGEWNKPNEDGTPNNEESIYKLATRCLDALDLPHGYDAARLDVEFYPHVKWEWQRPAEALASLCSMVGMDVALHTDNKVEIVQIGVGDAPKHASNRYHRRTDGLLYDGSPRKWIVRGGRTLIETTIEGFVPVGLDIDGSVRELADLSYAPNGAATYGGFDHDNITGLGINEESDAGKAALESVWRWYRIPDAQAYRLPILSERLTTATEDGVKRRRPPLVETKQANLLSHQANEAETWANGSSYVDVAESDYSLDRKRGIIMFKDAVFKAPSADAGKPKGAEGAWEAADVQLTFAHESVKTDGTFGTFDALDFFSYEEGQGDDYTLIERPDFVLHKVNSTFLNSTQLAAQAKELVKLRRAIPAVAKSGEHTIIGIADAKLNGLVRSVAVNVSASGGVTTTLSLSTERSVPRYLSGGA